MNLLDSINKNIGVAFVVVCLQLLSSMQSNGDELNVDRLRDKKPAKRETPAQKVERPNIILCMTDDQGWQDVGFNGHPFLKTPNLDRMSKSGLKFNRWYAAAPVCSPT